MHGGDRAVIPGHEKARNEKACEHDSIFRPTEWPASRNGVASSKAAADGNQASKGIARLQAICDKAAHQDAQNQTRSEPMTASETEASRRLKSL